MAVVRGGFLLLAFCAAGFMIYVVSVGTGDLISPFARPTVITSPEVPRARTKHPDEFARTHRLNQKTYHNVAREGHSLVNIPVSNGGATFDLPPNSSPHLIVIGSLSEELESYPVAISSRHIQEASPLPSSKPLAAPASLPKRNRTVSPTTFVSLPKIHNRPPQAHQTFWVMVRGNDLSDESNYVPVRADLHRVGKHCAAYVDRDCADSGRVNQLVELAIQTYDSDVYPTAQTHLGSHRDVNNDGHFTLLFTPVLQKLMDGTVSVGGFVRGSDFYRNYPLPISNRCDMMYLNSELQPDSHLKTLIAHEYTHAVTFSARMFAQHEPDLFPREEEGWLDESLAHIAENLNSSSWSNLDYRISGFLNAPERYGLIVRDYYSAGLWRGHGHRGSTYLFLRWLIDKYGTELLPQLVQTNHVGVENIEQAVGVKFETLFREWSVALFLSGSGVVESCCTNLTYLNLRQPLGNRQLGGPNFEYVADACGSDSELAATSCKYLVARPSNQPRRITVTGSVSSQLQVTLVPLPDDLGSLEMSIRSTEEHNGAPSVSLAVTNRGKTALQLRSFGWERRSPGTQHEYEQGCCSTIYLEDRIKEILGVRNLGIGSEHRTPMIELSGVRSGDEEISIKITAEDAAGRIVTAWRHVIVSDLRLLGVASERPIDHPPRLDEYASP